MAASTMTATSQLPTAIPHPDESAQMQAIQALTNSFNPVISSSSAYYSDYYGREQSQLRQPRLQSAMSARPQPEQEQQQVMPNICLCPQVARVPRPRNAFILYRQHHHAAVVADHPGKTNPEISKIIGEQWRQLSAEEKAVWQRLGDEEKKSHLERFPDYRYQPRRSVKRNSNDSYNGAHASQASPMNVSVCMKCHGQTSNTRGVFLPKPPVAIDHSPSPPTSSIAQGVVHPTIEQRYDQTYIADLNLPSTSASSDTLPPILPLPRDDMPHRPFVVRSRSQDDARKGVEALLSLTAATGARTPSPESGLTHRKNNSHSCSNTISSIINSEGSIDDDDNLHKRRCPSSREHSPRSRADSDAHAPSQSSGFYLPSLSQTLAELPPIQQHSYEYEVKTCRSNWQYWSSLPKAERFEVLDSIWHALPRDKPRGAIIAVEGDSDDLSQLVSEVVRRVENLALLATDVAENDTSGQMSIESKLIKRALRVHEISNTVNAFIGAGKSVILDKYVITQVNDSAKLLSEGTGVPPTRARVAEDWHWCLKLYRGTVAPDLVISFSAGNANMSTTIGPDGRTRVLEVAGIENISTIEQEIRKVMSDLH